MIIGVPKEIKTDEFRVGLTPTSVHELVLQGHQVIVESQCGLGIGESNDDYLKAGASIEESATTIYAQSDMIVKVKEPQSLERKMLRSGQILFTYLHLAPDLAQTRDLMDSGAVCIAYETVTSSLGGLPLLAPMSAVAGRLSIQAAAHCLEKKQGGKGVLMGGAPGVEKGKVVIIGGGVVGKHAAHMAIGLGADVTVLDRNNNVLNDLWSQFGHSINTAFSTQQVLEQHVCEADVVIGGVLIPGAAAPKLVSHSMVKSMQAGSVLVDVAIDQGGCFATSRATTHTNPTFMVDDVVHYCVANMPGAVPKTSTHMLNNATLPYVIALANKGYKQALKDDVHLLNGLNIHKGDLTIKEVAEVQGLCYIRAEQSLGD